MRGSNSAVIFDWKEIIIYYDIIHVVQMIKKKYRQAQLTN